MAGEYTVKILSSEEFNKLPFKRIQDNPDSVYGAADAKNRIAYVRDTGFNDFTKANIGHELDELMQSVSPHEEDGIRYKDLGSMFSGLGGAVKSGAGAVGGALKSGVGALGRGIKNVFTPGPAAQLGRTAPVPGPGGRLITGAAQAATPAALPASGGGGGLGGFLSDMFQGSGSAFKQGLSGQGVSQQAPTGGTLPKSGIPNTQNEATFMQQLFNSAGQNAPGMAVSGIGDLLSPKREELDISGVTDDLRSRITGEGRPPTDLFQAASSELLGNLGTTPTAPPESAFERGDQVIEEDLADQLKQLNQQFKAATGSTNVDNNSAYLAEKSRLIERSRERRASVRDEISFQYTREQLTRDLQEVEMALNLDGKQTEQLIRIAMLDAEAIAVNYNLDLREAQEFKDMFARFGDLMFRQRPEDQPTPQGATNAGTAQ